MPSSAPSTTLRATFTRHLVDGASASSLKDKAVALFHDHIAMMTLNPLVVRYERIEAAATSLGNANKEAYIITNKLSYLPFGLWDGEVSVYTEFADTPDGVRTLSRAPLRFVSESTWCVREQEDGGGWVVEERVEGRCPWGLKWFVEGKMSRNHEEALGKFVDMVTAVGEEDK